MYGIDKCKADITRLLPMPDKTLGISLGSRNFLRSYHKARLLVLPISDKTLVLASLWGLVTFNALITSYGVTKKLNIGKLNDLDFLPLDLRSSSRKMTRSRSKTSHMTTTSTTHMTWSCVSARIGPGSSS